MNLDKALVELVRKIAALGVPAIVLVIVMVGLWTNLKQKMDERAITGEKISDMRNRSTDDLGVLK
jgi:hypothetical protein